MNTLTGEARRGGARFKNVKAYKYDRDGAQEKYGDCRKKRSFHTDSMSDGARTYARRERSENKYEKYHFNGG